MKNKARRLKASALAGLPAEIKLDFAQAGNAADSPHYKSALFLANMIEHVAELERILPRLEPRLAKIAPAEIAKIQKFIQSEIRNRYAASRAKRDGGFFRALADAIERPDGGVEPEWGYVWTQIMGAREGAWPRPSIAKLKRDLDEMTGRDVDEKHVKRLIAYLEQ